MILFIFILISLLQSTERANEVALSNVTRYKNLGIQYTQINEWDEAIKCFKQCLTIVPKDIELLYWLGSSYYFKGDYREAEEVFRRLVEYEPMREDAYFNLGIVLAKQKKYDDVIRTLKKAIEVNHTDAEILFHLAGTYLVIGEYLSAIDTYTRIVDLFPADPRAYEGRASAYWKIGDNDASVADIKRAKELRSGRRLKIAEFKSEEKQKEEKEERLEIYTTDPQVLYSVGEIHQSTGELELAVKTYTAAIKLDPRNPKYYEKRAESYKSLGKTKEAMDDLEKAKELRNK